MTSIEARIAAYSNRLTKLVELTEELHAVWKAHEDLDRYVHIQDLMEGHALELALMARGWEHLGDKNLVGLFNNGTLEITIPKDLVFHD